MQVESTASGFGGAARRPACQMLIDGELVMGAGPILTVENPATEEVIAEIAQATSEQVNAAVMAARRAFESGIWADPDFRHEILNRFAALLEDNAAMLAASLVRETGTPVSISKFLQLDGPIDMLRDIGSHTHLAQNISLGVDERAPRSESLIRNVPIGVAAGIGAYNNPLLYLVSKACAAMAVGCTAVFVPSSLTPATVLLCSQLAIDAGIPAGVLNILVGSADVARALTLHPEVDKISMTGSVEIGRQVMSQAALGLKGVVLELGGKSAGIVLPGADLATVSMPLHGRYLRNSGQGCQSPTRLLVHDSMYDDFIDHARQSFSKIAVGDPLDPATVSGPLIRASHRDRVEGFVARAMAAGGQVAAGGGRPDFERGWFMNGTLLTGQDNHSEICRSELFGPVAVAMRYSDVDQRRRRLSCRLGAERVEAERCGHGMGHRRDARISHSPTYSVDHLITG